MDAKKTKVEEIATKVYDSGVARITSTEDKDFAKVAEATMKAALILDDIAPAPAGTGSRVSQIQAARDKRVSDAKAALLAGPGVS